VTTLDQGLFVMPAVSRYPLTKELTIFRQKLKMLEESIGFREAHIKALEQRILELEGCLIIE